VRAKGLERGEMGYRDWKRLYCEREEEGSAGRIENGERGRPTGSSLSCLDGGVGESSHGENEL